MTSSTKPLFSTYDSSSEIWNNKEWWDVIIRLDNDYFPNPWSELAWLDMIEKGQDYFLVVATQAYQVVGFSLFKLSPLEQLAHLLKILVIPAKRSQQLGVQLLQESLSCLQGDNFVKFYLEVEADNTKAIALYQRCDFQKIHQISNFYGASKDAIVMVRE